MNIRLGIVALCGMTALLPARSATGCECGPPLPTDKGFEQAAAVFVGMVQEIKQTTNEIRKVTLRIEQAWKGVPQPSADVVPVRSGMGHETYVRVGAPCVTVSTCASKACCGFDFREHTGYLVYAEGSPDRLTVSRCSRTRLLNNDAVADISTLNTLAAGERTAAPPPPKPEVAAGVDDGKGVTVGLQDGGMTVVAIDAASGKMIWKVKLQGPASAVRVEGDRVIVAPQNWVIDRATGKVISQ